MRERTDVQNIDLMNLAGFCRNCLANWYQEAAERKRPAADQGRRARGDLRHALQGMAGQAPEGGQRRAARRRSTSRSRTSTDWRTRPWTFRSPVRWRNGMPPAPTICPAISASRSSRSSRRRLSPALTAQKALGAWNGYLHAGAVVTLADTCCGYGTVRSLPAGASGFTTIELKSNFFGSAREGEDRMRRAAAAPGPHDAGVGRHGHPEGADKPIAQFRMHANSAVAEGLEKSTTLCC